MKMILIVIGLIARDKVSWKSNLGTWSKPLATYWAFIFFNRTIKVLFNVKHPFASSSLAFRRKRNQIPSMNTRKCVILLLHCNN